MTKLRSSAMALVLLVGGGSAALAQDEAATGEAGVQAEVGVKVGPNLSGEAQLEQAAEIERRGTRLANRLQKLLDAARLEGDIIRVTCLNDKLTQANANLRTVGRRAEALRNAVEVNDSDAANHEFTVLSVLSQKFQLLDQEANQCVGQDVYEPGAAQVVTTVDPNAPTDINAAEPAPSSPPPPTVTVPPPVSPSS